MQLAQCLKLPGVKDCVRGPLPAGRFTTLSSLVTVALPYLFAVAGLILFAYLVWGGFDYLTAMGDPKKAESGKNKITYAILGFLIIFASYWLVQIVSKLFNLGVY